METVLNCATVYYTSRLVINQVKSNSLEKLEYLNKYFLFPLLFISYNFLKHLCYFLILSSQCFITQELKTEEYIIVFLVGQSTLGFPGGSMIKNPFANAGDLGWILGSGRSSGEGNGKPLQYSCLGYPMDRHWWVTVHGVAKQLGTNQQLNTQPALRHPTYIMDQKNRNLFPMPLIVQERGYFSADSSPFVIIQGATLFILYLCPNKT